MVGTDDLPKLASASRDDLNQKTKPFLNHYREVMDLNLTIVIFMYVV